MGVYLPLMIGTGIFGALFIFMPCFVKKGPYQGIIRCSMLLAVFSMWMFWATVYISQMKPLVGPRHKNSTLIFWRYKEGAIPIKEKGGGETPTTTATEAPPPTEVSKKPAGRAHLRDRPDFCQDQPDNMFECCNIPWLPRYAREKCIQEPINVFKLTCAEARCAFQEARWFVRPGEVNLAQLNGYYDSLIQANKEWTDAVRLIKAECLQINPKFQSVFTNCVEFDIMYCAMIRMLKRGPLDNWSTAAACAATKQFTAACPICPEECNARDLGQYPETVCRACVTV